MNNLAAQIGKFEALRKITYVEWFSFFIGEGNELVAPIMEEYSMEVEEWRAEPDTPQSIIDLLTIDEELLLFAEFFEKSDLYFESVIERELKEGYSQERSKLCRLFERLHLGGWGAEWVYSEELLYDFVIALGTMYRDFFSVVFRNEKLNISEYRSLRSSLASACVRMFSDVFLISPSPRHKRSHMAQMALIELFRECAFMPEAHCVEAFYVAYHVWKPYYPKEMEDIMLASKAHALSLDPGFADASRWALY